MNFVIANPLYARRLGGRTYTFTHGTHFRRELVSRRWVKKMADLLVPDKIFGDLEIKSECDARRANSLEELERIVAPFVDSRWPASEGNPASSFDQLSYLRAVLRGKFGEVRNAPKAGSGALRPTAVPSTSP